MSINTYQKSKSAFCRQCNAQTLHIAEIKQQSIPSVFIVHGLLTLVTCGLWLPIAALAIGAAVFGNSLSGFGGRYRCSRCGK